MTDYDPTKGISLADLASQPIPFYDSAYGGEGTRHEMRMYDHFGPEHLGELYRCQADLSAHYGALAKATADDAETLARVGVELAATLSRMVGLLIPTLPPERLAAIPYQAKERIIQAWTAAQPPSFREARASAPLAQPTARGRRSRASSASTA